MANEIVYEKAARRADKGLERKTVAARGKKPNQKLKPHLVLQFLLRNTAEDHVVSGDAIAESLKRCGVDAEHRSVYRDIEDINKVYY